MKTNLNILLMSVALLVAQGCGSKSEKSEATDADADQAIIAPDLITVSEKRAKLEEQRAARAERRRIAFEERYTSTPFFTDNTGNTVYNKAEIDPSYIGGEKALMKYLNDNIAYPKEAEEKGLEGTVFVDFVVTASGTVREVEVTDEPGEDIDPSFGIEAIRLVKSMPQWQAGRQHGQPVDVKFSLPITFQMM